MTSNQQRQLQVQLSDTKRRLGWWSPEWDSESKRVYLLRKIDWLKKQLKHDLSRKPKRLANEPRFDQVTILETKVRIPHRKGWYNEWQPTRKRYWRPVNNNWKQHSKHRKQWMKNL